jgi:uncharacterized damage-inducible protein DinB
MNANEAAGMRDFFAMGLDAEAKTTRKVLAAVPDGDMRNYRPDPKSRTGFELAWHIAASDAWFLDGIIKGAFDPSSDKSNAVPAEIKTTADIVAFYDKNYAAALSKLNAMTGEQLAKVTDFFGVFQFPLVVYLSWLNNHEIHHRGQLCAYLRAMGGKVPSIYGGSADEPFQMGASA